MSDLISSDNILQFRSNLSPMRPQAESGGASLQREFDGPLSGELWRKVKELDSKYPDNFDWSVYDKLHTRFGDQQPRGGVIFKTTFKIVNYHTSCSKCHYSFEIDTYGRGCVHNCVYCYAKDQLSAHGFWNRPMPFPVDLAEVRKTFHTVFETDKPHRWRDIIFKRTPLRIGSMSDSFMWMDQKYGVTKELLRILKYYKYPHIVFTRSDLIAQDEYIDLMDRELISIQFSISGGNEQLTKAIEPGAPSVKRRLAALKKLGEHGFWTTVRINPFFPIYPDGYYTDPESVTQRFGSHDASPRFPLFDWEFIDDLKEAKVPSVLAGFVRLSPKAINTISNITKIDLKTFFKPELYAKAGDKKYSDAEIGHYYKLLHEQATSRGLRFNTCYIGNGEKDYFQYQNLWSNKKDCCDALGKVSAFKGTSQDIGWEQRIKLAPCKKTAQTARAQEIEMQDKFSTLNSPPEVQI